MVEERVSIPFLDQALLSSDFHQFDLNESHRDKFIMIIIILALHWSVVRLSSLSWKAVRNYLAAFITVVVCFRTIPHYPAPIVKWSDQNPTKQGVRRRMVNPGETEAPNTDFPSLSSLWALTDIHSLGQDPLLFILSTADSIWLS